MCFARLQMAKISLWIIKHLVCFQFSKEKAFGRQQAHEAFSDVLILAASSPPTTETVSQKCQQ